ncbi:UPF0398 protein [Companilactobacillus sp. RD055328]|uniref:SLOG family protein n=1 Tax=Companilactobacillus sp. RD055328 TaxID=2916634 RepID=UPI001FC7F1DD|nr:SLOG family protein [Companilactobacillus sp. RD055328]GKQ42688.1 UPF0398 protein [Companilactobacillus sp. RD055328]
MITRLWITGYRSFELGIFNKNDKKIEVLSMFLKRRIEQYQLDGLEWVITGAQLGIEQITINTVANIKENDTHLKNAVMLPFKDFGANWNENNTLNFKSSLNKSNYVNYVSNEDYQSPQQLKNWQQFMLNHTDGLLIIYDPEKEGKPNFDYLAAIDFAKNHNYSIELVTFEDLEDFTRELADEEIN